MSTTLIASRRGRPIGLTALIDVVFILLMFFMLTTNFNRWKAQSIDIPAAGQSVAESATPHFLLMLESGVYALLADGLRSEDADLDTILQHRVLSKGDASSLVVVPDADLPLQAVVDTLAALGERGVSHVSLGQSAEH